MTEAEAMRRIQTIAARARNEAEKRTPEQGLIWAINALGRIQSLAELSEMEVEKA